jgi:cytochrome c-type biogenesis protein
MWIVVLLAMGLFAGAAAWSSLHADTPAPPFTLTSTGFEDGVRGEPVAFALSDYAGRTVVLDFMAVACTACQYVTEDVLKPLWDRHADDPRFAILSIDTWADPGTGSFGGETNETLRALQQRTGVPWRHALDTDQVWQKYGAVTLPRLAVVSGDGRIVHDTGIPTLAGAEAAVQASLAGEAASVPILRVGLTGLAALAGGASVFTPCSAGLLPAYLGMLLGDAAAQPAPARLRRAARGGLGAAAGIVAVYAALALLFWAAGPLMQRAVPWLGPAAALGVAVAGALAVLGRGLPWLGRLGGAVGGTRGFFLFGLAFALVGFGCTAPLFLPILLAGFLEGPAVGALAFLAYAATVAAAVLLMAVLAGQGSQGPVRRLLAWTRRVQAVAGWVMLAAGVYLLAYFLGRP